MFSGANISIRKIQASKKRVFNTKHRTCHRKDVASILGGEAGGGMCFMGCVLLPRHQPLWLNVALSQPVHVDRKLMWTILQGQRASSTKLGNSITNQPDVKASLFDSASGHS